MNELQNKLWDLRGYDVKYLLSLNEEETLALYDTEFYYED